MGAVIILVVIKELIVYPKKYLTLNCEFENIKMVPEWENWSRRSLFSLPFWIMTTRPPMKF